MIIHGITLNKYYLLKSIVLVLIPALLGQKNTVSYI